MSEKWKVRFAMRDDLDELVQASAEVLQDLKNHGKSDWYGGNDKEEFEEVLKAEINTGCVIAESEQGVIGYLVFNNHNEATCHERFPEYPIGKGFCVDGMGVIPEYKGQGVLTSMLWFVEKYAEVVGKEFLYGTVYPENYPSICSFARHASTFRVSEETERYQMKDGRILIRKYFLAQI